MTPKRGKWIVFEGMDGSGKSTQIDLLKKALEKKGIDEVLVTQEPGGSPIGLEIRQILLGHKEDPPCSKAEHFLFQAGRAEHVEKTILPALERGAWVICDRFYYSSLAYQGIGRNLGWDQVLSMSQYATSGHEPDLILVLDVDLKTAKSRTLQRGEKDPEQNTRFETEKASFQKMVKDSFLRVAKEFDHATLINANEAPEIIHKEIFQHMIPYLGGK